MSRRLAVSRELKRIGPRLSQRQLRLFACACCHWLDREGRFAAVIDLAERFADGRAGAAELAAARFASRFRPGNPAWAVCWAPDEEPLSHARRALAWVEGQSSPVEVDEPTGPAGFLLDIARTADFSPPPVIHPAWLA